jgi:hypothetical protein
MRLLRHLAVFSACIALGSAAFAQQQGYARSYPQTAQQQYISDCMQQTTQQALPVAPRVAQSYCGCMFTYLQERVPYQAYQRYDQMLRAGKGQQIDPQFRNVVQQGATLCIQRYVLSGGAR